MSKNKTPSIFNFIKWVTLKYIELDKITLPYPCRLIEIFQKNRCQLAKIQFTGSLNEITISTSKIIEHNLFEFFSPEDKKTIFSASFFVKKFSLCDIYYCPSTNKNIIVISDENENRKTVTAEYLTIDNCLIDKISSRDANRIGFLAGLEYYKKYLKAQNEDDSKRAI